MNVSKMMLIIFAGIVLTLVACSSENSSIVEHSEYTRVSEDVILQSSTSAAEPEDAAMVYVAPYGKRYHYSKRCAGGNAMEVKLSDVIFKPCKKCAR